MRRRVTVVTSGPLATTPRMLKAATALQGAGYDVRVVSTALPGWAVASERRLRAASTWRWTTVSYDRGEAPVRWAASGAAHRLAQSVVRPSWPAFLVRRAFSRFHDGLVRAIVAEPADLVYGGTSGGIGAVVEAGRRMGVPVGVDFEDFHCAQHGESDRGRLNDRLAHRVMAEACGAAAFVTAGSAAIAAACEREFGRAVTPINNTFPLPATAPAPTFAGGPLRLYWFSQTIGVDRGLEDVVRAAGRVARPLELHLRGTAAAGYVEALTQYATRVAPDLRLQLHPSVDPEAMVETCRGFDAGLAVEPGHAPHYRLALTNKALTYPLAGLPMILTDTEGQRPLIESLSGEAIVYTPGDVSPLIDGLTRWAGDPAARRRAGDAAWAAARTRWHWTHPLERDRLLAAVHDAIR